MANIKAKVRNNKEIVAKTVKIGTAQLSLGDLTDVDTSGQSDGVMMIYNATSGKYEVTTQIGNDELNIIGGTYQYGKTNKN